jgi:hypothetical protein
VVEAVAGALSLILAGKALADDPHHLDLQIAINLREARSRCAPILVKGGDVCLVGEFGHIGTVAGHEFLYAQYDFKPAPGISTASLAYSRMVVFERPPSAMLRPILVSGDDAAFFYQSPKLLHSGGRILLHVPATENGSGNFNREMLYVQVKDGWRDVDVMSWQDELAHRLPNGLAVRQGVYPNYTMMAAATPLWRDQDG